MKLVVANSTCSKIIGNKGEVRIREILHGSIVLFALVQLLGEISKVFLKNVY